MSKPDISFVDETVGRLGREPQSLIPILQAIQQHYRYLPEEALRRVSEITQITAAQIAGVSTFYTQFRHHPVGRHIVSVCNGTACHVKGAEFVYEALRRHLKLQGDNDTDADGVFTVQKVTCLGCCTLAPAMQIDDVTYGHLSGELVPVVLDEFLELQRRDVKPWASKTSATAKAKDNFGEIRLGLGSCCVASGSGRVYKAFQEAIYQTQASVAIKRVGCVGMCHHTPLVEVITGRKESFLYSRLQPEDAKNVILRHFRPKGHIRRFTNAAAQVIDKILTDAVWQPVGRRSIDVREKPVAAFLDRQKHIATEYCGDLDPVDLDEYLARGGFGSLRRCVTERQGQDAIEQIRLGRLRGRGGAGYPTADKWAAVSKASGKKYIICNGDEGDPGAFMDRMLLESYPYRIIEGMAIAAYAVGADEGYFYIRAEYPLAVRRIRAALSECSKRQLLGEDIYGSGFKLKIHIMEGAGAFVCGEETALLRSIEGGRGMPRLRPPYPAQSGLWQKPTLVNNVETYAVVPWIIRYGGEAFAAIGTEHSKGTKVFSLAGKVARGGLIEVPMGISIRQIVEDIGGGIAGGKRFKAVQIGGPSGGCVPAELAETSVDYEALVAAGAIMGSGGLVLLDEDDCMVDIARYFLEFTQSHSCGKCTFCRIGTRRMLDVLERLCQGQGRKGDLEELEHLAEIIQKASLCGLGRTAPNPVLSTLRYFRDEYEAHLEKRCPAGKCKKLIRYEITDDCIGCTLCAQHCPVNAIAMQPYERHEIDTDKCIRCGTCKNICPNDAVKVE